MIRLFGLGRLVAALVLAWVLALLAATSAGAAPVHVRSAWLIDLTEPGAIEHPVRLPDGWEHTAPRRNGRASYRLSVPDSALQVDRPSLFLRRAGNAFRVHFNGQSVLEVGGDTLPLPNYNNEPHLIRLPRTLLRASGNTLVIEVIGQPKREAGLSTVWVGNDSELEPLYEQAMTAQVRGSWFVISASLVMGMLALLLAWRTRLPMYGWFALANLVWAWRVSALNVHAPGIWAGPLHWAFELSYSVFVASISMSLLTVIQRDTPIARRLMAGFVGSALLLSLGNALFNLPLLRTAHLLLILVVTVSMAVFLAHYTVRERSRTGALLCFSAVVGAIFGARDWVVFRLQQDYDAYTWSRYAIFFLLFVMAWRLVEDYSSTLARLRDINRNLQDAVERKQNELQLAFESRREVERHQAASAERDRILREMHDGLGGRLVGAIALSQQLSPSADGIESPTLHQLRQALDDCLVELRLSLDSLEAEQCSIGEALAEMRFRVEPSLRAAGVRLVWNVDDEAVDAELRPGDTLQVLRIVREAFTNVIKHAQATVVWLTLARAGHRIELTVLDNGLLQRSTPGTRRLPAMPSGKRGLANMRQRAQHLGADIEIGPHPEGWSVRLSFSAPVPAAVSKQNAA
ncbi:histidine kinase [Schlegelella sp. S2-27]|uniref:histidine kinase n=1 Tax=Caldimonas mangrovi TaxID=2944811 RepID=A0ABT0YK99_9BURK|nr:ATP-binding protein [Caldimonas mangrovi]MCM5679165.1 histidine kinase [Caldimonas mangrovi]